MSSGKHTVQQITFTQSKSRYWTNSISQSPVSAPCNYGLYLALTLFWEQGQSDLMFRKFRTQFLQVAPSEPLWNGHSLLELTFTSTSPMPWEQTRGMSPRRNSLMACNEAVLHCSTIHANEGLLMLSKEQEIITQWAGITSCRSVATAYGADRICHHSRCWFVLPVHSYIDLRLQSWITGLKKLQHMRQNN